MPSQTDKERTKAEKREREKGSRQKTYYKVYLQAKSQIKGEDETENEIIIKKSVYINTKKEEKNSFATIYLHQCHI